MIRIAFILLVVLACFNMPTYHDSVFTELGNLRENSGRSLLLGALAVYFCRSIVGYGIAIIEWVLLASTLYIAYCWEFAPAFYLAKHYETLQVSAYFAELMLILVGILIEALRSGADVYNYNSWNLPSPADSSHRSVRT